MVKNHLSAHGNMKKLSHIVVVIFFVAIMLLLTLTGKFSPSIRVNEINKKNAIIIINHELKIYKDKFGKYPSEFEFASIIKSGNVDIVPQILNKINYRIIETSDEGYELKIMP